MSKVNLNAYEGFKPTFERKACRLKAQAQLFTFAQLKYFLLPESAKIQCSFTKKSLEPVL